MGFGLHQDGIQPVRLKGRPAGTILFAIRHLLQCLADSFLPRHCLSCGTALSATSAIDLCPACTREALLCGPDVCSRCGAPSDSPDTCICHDPAFETVDMARSAFAWTGPPRSMVLALKYSRKWELARPMATVMAAVWAASGGGLPDLVTSVPAIPRRFLARGYNQAALLASAFSAISDFPADNFVLIRQGPPQSTRGLGANERRRLAAGSFHVRSGRDVRGRIILLVDDVLTTGATVSDCARALKSAGARRVDVLTFARSVHLP